MKVLLNNKIDRINWPDPKVIFVLEEVYIWCAFHMCALFISINNVSSNKTVLTSKSSIKGAPTVKTKECKSKSFVTK